MGGACRMHGRDEKYIQNCSQKPEGKRSFRKPSHNGKIILE